MQFFSIYTRVMPLCCDAYKQFTIYNKCTYFIESSCSCFCRKTFRVIQTQFMYTKN